VNRGQQLRPRCFHTERPALHHLLETCDGKIALSTVPGRRQGRSVGNVGDSCGHASGKTIVKDDPIME